MSWTPTGPSGGSIELWGGGTTRPRAFFVYWSIMKTDNPPRISIIVPVYHEAERIAALLDCLEDLDPRRISERVVVEGAPEGDTLRAIEDRDIVAVRSSRGRARQMNAGAKAASGDILLFLHADTTLPPGTLDAVEDAFADDDVVGGAFCIRFDSKRLMLKLFGRIDSWRARITRVPYGDQAIFVRRDYFNMIGRYSDIPLMEDIELMKRIKRRGNRIRILQMSVTSSSRRWEREGHIFCTARNCMLVVLYSLGVSPRFLKRFYPDNPVIRGPFKTRPERDGCRAGERKRTGDDV
ncbi:MAG: TIGR04283 family arsenosugar biosynthesis glycosyltransferase [Candidatus Latescibacterota bacterium]|nr:MAG: TIGR04283 family arsenosugar biosynthesis glycosyltransferase [Candidatus Latescibacterota bacterium]